MENIAEMQKEELPLSLSAVSDNFDLHERLECYCAFFAERPEERASFARIALSMRRAEMAAIAAAAELRLAPGPDADAFADKAVDLALADANEAILKGYPKLEALLLRAGHLAARTRSEATEKVNSCLNERLIEEIERDPIELEVIKELIGIGSVPLKTLTDIFHKADALGAYAVASAAAQAVVDASQGKVNRDLLIHLRSQSRQLLAARDALGAAFYFMPLFRMAPEVESVAVLLPRVVRLVADALRERDLSAVDKAMLVESLDRLDTGNPILLRQRALSAAQRGDSGDARYRLDALAAAVPSGWSYILSEARSALKLGNMRYAMILYGWLAARGHAASEAEKARVRELRARLVTLRDCAKGNDAEAEKAASEVLEVEPENARALWIKGRALLRLRRNDEALATLRRLVQVSPQYPGASDLLQRQENKSPQARALS